MRSILITGGAGFIGSNASVHFARKGWRVVVLDDLSRMGADRNLEWIRSEVAVEFIRADIRDAEAVAGLVRASAPDVILHLAAQVAVTKSVVDPRTDFEINAIGTLNLLEAVRRHSPGAFIIYASTNKVYGDLARLSVEERGGRYEFRDSPGGVSEAHPLEFHSPYGCSKGAADQYVLDYGKSFGLATVAMRQSCIYGPRQFGVEDQGWLAWFVIACVLGRSITIYGDGKQIRDVLHVEDLIAVYEAAIEQPDAARGQAFNIGGGPRNTLSLLELLEHLRRGPSKPLPLAWGDWRVGDQKVFVCDIAKAGTILGWQPRIDSARGVQSLLDWVTLNRALFT